MKMSVSIISFICCSLLLSFLFSCKDNVASDKNDEQHEPTYSYSHPIPFSPQHYVCQQTNNEIIIDGRLDEKAWEHIGWTDLFVDIEGNLKEKPSLQTKAKMTWDTSYFYIAAILYEPHIWATLTQRDAIMYHDDDFEIFIDPDGDGHNYFEFEMNAFNAIWDLYMLYPYYIDDERNYIMNWDIRGIRTAVHIEGTINNPSDIDKYWSVEVAIPWETFSDFKKGPDRPMDGDQWRINFSRVDWTVDVENGKYIKIKNDQGKTLPEDNWVWSPTGYINMHKPEVWGYLQFESSPGSSFNYKDDENIKWGLWQIYYQVRDCKKDKGVNCELENISIPNIEIKAYDFKPQLVNHPFGFTISCTSMDGSTITLNEKGKIQYIN